MTEEIASLKAEVKALQSQISGQNQTGKHAGFYANPTKAYAWTIDSKIPEFYETRTAASSMSNVANNTKAEHNSWQML